MSPHPGRRRESGRPRLPNNSILPPAAFRGNVAREGATTRGLTAPNLMTGRTADVPVLFADVRSFSESSEKLGPEKAIGSPASRCYPRHTSFEPCLVSLLRVP